MHDSIKPPVLLSCFMVELVRIQLGWWIRFPTSLALAPLTKFSFTAELTGLQICQLRGEQTCWTDCVMIFDWGSRRQNSMTSMGVNFGAGVGIAPVAPTCVPP